VSHLNLLFFVTGRSVSDGQDEANVDRSTCKLLIYSCPMLLNLKGRDRSEDLDVDGRIVLER
jgi:hypothetical protein